ncbi:VOC family protein [Paenibacillus sp. HB172176]|uniref:VOC family protein n=1 Tax=Paenibacillus sp. HB172176 TaxID=2493690 RepID=UPI00143A3A98|nr:VOC family protein [Paenibacillus sp. HB172176]
MTNMIHPETRLGEVKLKVSQLERSIAFYQDVIGFRVLNQYDRTAELTADGSSSLLVLEEIPNAITTRPRTTSGLYHFAILLPTRRDLGMVLRRLIEAKLQLGQADHLVSEAIYLSDPDQNGIEIYRDRPREEWKHEADGSVVMDSLPIDWEGLLNEAKDVPWTGLPAGTTIGHVHFHVHSLEQAKAFYCDALGFEMQADLGRRMGALFIGAGGYHHHIGLNIWAGQNAPRTPQNATGLAYAEIILPSGEELEAVIKRLRDSGYSASYEDGFWFIIDPSGITLKLSAA